MFNNIRKDIAEIKKQDPAARNSAEVFLLYSGLHAIWLHRPAHWLYRKKIFFLARFISQISRFLTGIEIHPGAEIGHGVLIDHGSGVVIGETAVVGDGCVIYQGVTLGGTGKDKGKRHPTLGKNIMVGSGARILGPIDIGDDSKIASNAVVLQSLPPASTAVGVPARIVRVKGKKVEMMGTLRQSDPLAQEVVRLANETKLLNERLAKLEKLMNNENINKEGEMDYTKLECV